VCWLQVGWAILAFGARICLEIGQQVLLIIGISLGCSGLVFSLSGVEWLWAGMQTVVQFCTKLQQWLFSAPGARFKMRLKESILVISKVIVAMSFTV
jgi:hypothetical protein